MGVRGRKSKIEEQRFVQCHMERWWPKNGSIPSRIDEKQKRRIDLKEQRDRQTDRRTRTDRQSQRQKNNRLLGYRRGDQNIGLHTRVALRTLLQTGFCRALGWNIQGKDQAQHYLSCSEFMLRCEPCRLFLYTNVWMSSNVIAEQVRETLENGFLFSTEDV